MGTVPKAPLALTTDFIWEEEYSPETSLPSLALNLKSSQYVDPLQILPHPSLPFDWSNGIRQFELRQGSGVHQPVSA